jgi:hypothetical protein
MSNPKTDKLATQLKDSLAQRRPRPWKFVLTALAGSVLLLLLLAWWLYPQAKSPPLQVIAFDVLSTPDETPHARAQLLALPDDIGPHRWSGRTIVFHEQPLLLGPNKKPREIVAKSDERGQASVEWPVEQAALTEYLVLHVDAEQRRGSAHERGRIFVWPKNTSLLIVDADETLLRPNLDAKAAPEILAKAVKDDWRIVYLALAGTQTHQFRKTRDSIEKQALLPKGPILGRKFFTDETTVASARHDVIQELQSRFKGTMLAVVSQRESAKVCEDLGMRTVVIGGAEVATWAEVSVKLK